MKKRLIQIFITLSFFVICNSVYAQITTSFRRLVLKSDVILIYRNYPKNESKNISDYITEHKKYISANNIDSILVNKKKFKKSEYHLTRLIAGEDIFEYSIDENNSVMTMLSISENEDYLHLLFLKKIGKGYQLLGSLMDVKSKIKNYYIPQIEKLTEINKINDLKEKYKQNIYWFLDNNMIPDEHLINYYAEQGIITKDDFLDEDMLQVAKQKFENGNEKLDKLIKDKFPETIKNYYFKKIKETVSKEKLTYLEYYEFYFALGKLINIEYDTIEYISRDLLTSDTLDDHTKKKIMRYFINRVEEDKEKNQH